jgi:hypothetical protein
MLGFVGVIAIDTSVADVTVTIVDPDLFPQNAQIFALPVHVAFVLPGLRYELEYAADDGVNPVNCATSVPDATSISSTDEEVQVTDDVRSCVVLSV